MGYNKIDDLWKLSKSEVTYMKKRLLSMLLAVVLVFSMIPQAAFAAEDTLFGLITETPSATNAALNTILSSNVLPQLAAMDAPLDAAAAPEKAAGTLKDGLLTAEAVGDWSPARYLLGEEVLPYEGPVQLEGDPDLVSVIYTRDLGEGKVQGVYDYVSALARETSRQKENLDSISTGMILTALDMLDASFIEAMIYAVEDLDRWDLGFSDITNDELEQVKAEYIQIIEQLLDRLVEGDDLYMEYLNRRGYPEYEDYLRVYAMLSEYDNQGLYHYYTNYRDINRELTLLSGCLHDLMGEKQSDGSYENEDIVNALLREMGYGLLVKASDLADIAEQMIGVANALPQVCTYIDSIDLSDADAVKVLFGQDRGDTPLVTTFSVQELNPVVEAESAPLEITAAPKVPEAIQILDEQGQDITGQTLDVDLFEGDTLQLAAGLLPEKAQGDITWKVSDSKIAAVDEGLVTAKKPGTVTVTASIAKPKLSATVKLNIFSLEEAKKLTAEAEIPAMGLQSGFTSQLLVFGAGDEPLDPANLSFSIPEKESKIASVDENGLITAGHKTGTATVTAAIKDDPMNRKVSLKVKVIPIQTESLSLLPMASDPAEVLLLDASGEVTDDPDLAVNAIINLNAEDLDGDTYLFRISAAALDSLGLEQELTAKSLKWTTTDSRIATVKGMNNGIAIVTVKKGTDGACVIGAVTTDLAKIENGITIHVRDYTPRLESASLTLNPNRIEGVSTALLPSYGNGILSISLHDSAGKKGYQEEPSQKFTASWEDGLLTLDSTEFLKNGTYKLLLKAETENGKTYEYPLTVKVSNTLPTVTVKQSGKLNLFHTDSETAFSVTAKGGTISDVLLVEEGTSFVSLGFDAETGTLGLKLSDAYLNGEVPMSKKAEIHIFFEGYESAVSKSITIATEKKAPKLTLSDASSLVYTALEGEHSAVFTVEGAQDATISVEAPFAEALVEGNQVKLILTGTKGGNAVITVTKDTWADAVTLKHKVTVQTKLPTVKLKTATLKLNTVLGTEALAETAMTLTKGATDFAITGFACETEYEGFTLTLEGNTLTAQLTDTEAADKTLKLQPILTHLPTGEIITLEKPLTLKVDIFTGKPSLTLSSSGKLDTLVPGSAITYTIKKLTNISGTPSAVRLEGDGAERFDVSLEGQSAKLTLKKGAAQEKNKTYKLELVFTIGSQEVAAKITVKVNQGTMKFAYPKKLNLYQANSRLACVLEVTAPEGASIEGITLGSKTTAPLARALGNNAVTYVELNDGRVLVSFKVNNPAYLTYGKSYTLYLDVTPKGNAENAQPTSLKLTVKTFK